MSTYAIERNPILLDELMFQLKRFGYSLSEDLKTAKESVVSLMDESVAVFNKNGEVEVVSESEAGIIFSDILENVKTYVNAFLNAKEGVFKGYKELSIYKGVVLGMTFTNTGAQFATYSIATQEENASTPAIAVPGSTVLETDETLNLSIASSKSIVRSLANEIALAREVEMDKAIAHSVVADVVIYGDLEYAIEDFVQRCEYYEMIKSFTEIELKLLLSDLTAYVCESDFDNKIYQHICRLLDDMINGVGHQYQKESALGIEHELPL